MDLVRNQLNPRIANYLRVIGFWGIVQAGYFEIDHGLITALIERWRQETHTFHLPIGEATVTLQDVEVLWGLRVDGLPVTLIDRNRNIAHKKQLIEEHLGFRPETRHFKDGRLKLVLIFDFLYEPLPDDAPEELVRQHVRCYILILFAGQLFADTCGNVVSCHWLDYLRDLEVLSNFRWGNHTFLFIFLSV